MHVRVVIPLRTHSKLNQRLHWAHRARTAKNERKTALYWLRTEFPGVISLLDLMGPIEIRLVRRGPTVGLDLDNLQASLKSVRDGVADWLKIDDGDARLQWHYVQDRADRWEVVIEITGPDRATDFSALNPRAAWPFPDRER